ncbi:sister chromatid cohesion protein 1 [Zygosaccharomyces mellis]|uniref:Sister chromatid cohesion protein 1 n=1 Tax=Zygosaccharomyces mellis TaxID=42258 RepID=A0A4C2EBH6_9SACH|nr:sister chromatid cohesion protein 1 [Zygosaccharomyces mellis]
MSETHTISISAKNGPLAQIWLAANMSNLGRGQVLQTSISESANEIAKASGCDNGVTNIEHITLRTSGELLQGIVRVYSKQAAFLLSDIKDTLTKISTLFKTNQRINITVNRANTIAAVDQLILEDAVTEKEVLAAPSLDFLNDSQISEELMDQETEGSRQRQVQGAAPWDTSLEFGRRFDPDEDLEYNQSSGLDLDFDIDDGQLSKNAGEGTRQSNETGIQAQEPEHLLIGEDDFPLEDPNNVDWDLGISEEKDQERATSEAGSHDSVELGRRADERSVTGEPIDFGFNLDIEKEAGEEEDQMQQENDEKQEQRHQEEKREEEAKRERRVRKDPALRNCRKIQQDAETELDDHSLKTASEDTVNERSENEVQEPPKLNQKRLWEEMVQSLSYLPQEVIENFSPLQTFKKPKIQAELENEQNFEEPQMDISLGLNDDLLPESSINSSRPPSESGEAPMAADIGEHSLEEGEEMHEHNIEQQSSQDSHEMEDSSSNPVFTDSEKVKLTTGEFASREAVDFAELMRVEFIDNESLKFDNLLTTKKRAQGHEEDVGLTRQEATKGFFEMLSLATADCIDLDQQETFGDINISARPALYERFISA